MAFVFPEPDDVLFKGGPGILGSLVVIVASVFAVGMLVGNYIGKCLL